MPGPDYPWATYIPAGTWKPRQPHFRLTAVVLHARPLGTPEAVDQLIHDRTSAYHYIVTSTGAIIQTVPERGYAHHLGKPTSPRLGDHRTISICLDGNALTDPWPGDQVLATSRILSVLFSTRGPLPVHDAATICSPPGRIAPIHAWPWLQMHARVIRLDTPLQRIYDAMAAGLQIAEP